MNLWLRLIGTLLRAVWAPALKPPLERSHLHFRVWPTDLDLNMHMNNGRYLTLMDLGRTDLILRMGLLGVILKNGWMPVLSVNAVRFRRELRLWEPFEMETVIRYWEGATFVMEHRIRFTKGRKRGDIAATALVKGGFYDRKERSFISVERLLAAMNLPDAVSPPLSPEVEALLATETALRAYDQADRA